MQNRFPLQSRSPETRYGSWIYLEQDSHQYYCHPGQHFVPHEVLPGTFDWYWKGRDHPFLGCEGMLVGITPWLSKYVFGGASSGFITRVRTMRCVRSNRFFPIGHQVEILGRPTMWSGACHFERLT